MFTRLLDRSRDWYDQLTAEPPLDSTPLDATEWMTRNPDPVLQEA